MNQISFYIFIGFLTDAMAHTESFPKNFVVLVGKETAMSCNQGPDTLYVDWYFVVVGGSDEAKLSSKLNIFSAGKDLSVSGEIPGERLSINSTELKHAGQYVCTPFRRRENVSRVDARRFSAQVIVMESDPECHLNASTVVEGNNIEMWCIVRYSANWVPVMEWREMNGNIFTNEVLTEYTNNSLTSTVIFLAVYSKHNLSYSVQIYFTAPQNQTNEDVADNIPDYNYTWSSPLVQVLYGPKEASLSPQKEFYSKGDKVVCSAEANPSPRFEWKILKNNETFDGPVLVIRSEMIRGDGISIQCSAINDAIDVQAKSHIVKISSGEYRGNYSTANLPTTKIVTITLVFICAVLVFLVLIIIQKNIKEWIAKLCRNEQVEERQVNADIVPLEIIQNELEPNNIMGNQRYNQSYADIGEGAIASAVQVNDHSACRYIIKKKAMGESSKPTDRSAGEGTCKYVDMIAPELKSTVAPPTGPSLFSMSIYASIDHTAKVPSPPPQQHRRL